ncbi:signal peptidase I [Salinibacillus xinjiangensis]|uniref:Signal peptidase I n=1 Tax=Salinibacillus xinjiangensis TaxID=1229268 RepID=A0A6G1X3R7_9BACI|nr:signal peptidase I [Salinibacillus xinjiangensis]MRG85592.1 signal peptidase I [Salinibacillus xinjiangensis]
MAKEIWEWGKAILIAIGLAFIIRSFVFATSVVEGASMYPTLENGERVIFNKAIYYLSEPDRGDIVIIQRPTKNYVKRVVGLPNDVIEVKDHTLYINDKKKDQIYLDEEAINGTGDFGPITVPSDSYFVMGDNRSISKDSRNGLGFIEEDEIIGRSELIIYPFGEFSLTR